MQAMRPPMCGGVACFSCHGSTHANRCRISFRTWRGGALWRFGSFDELPTTHRWLEVILPHGIFASIASMY